MSKTIYIGGRLESKEKGNVVTGANAILDDTKGKKQNVINKETDDELLRLEQSKQDNLNFDNAPTENSTNPVTSGGVYSAEKALSDAIEAILLLIPSAATALNKLVDTNTMNSSISTATATFRGTYNAVSDLGLTYQATHAQIEAALDALGLTADNNDFVFVQIPVSDLSQDIAKTERFKFNGINWLYEYDLNTSGFTAAQWAAINSGITVALVMKLTDLPTAAALQLALNAKQDNLTFDNEPTALSQNPVTSGGIYTAIQAVATALSNYSETTDGRLNTLEGLIPTGASSSNKLTDKAYVDGLIQAITELIPAEADTTNQLADKAYVLAQILAATPAFKGQFVTLAELQAVASPKAGDLGIVRTKDSDGMDVFTVYQYLSNAWNVFYSLSYHPQTKPATTGTTGDYPYNGMGRVELAMNMVNTGTELAPVMVNQLTQDMFYKGAVGSRVPNTNTIFVIRYDYVLAENITIPDNCVLEFEGGSISGAYTLTGANTIIKAGALHIFKGVVLDGSFQSEIGMNIMWFGGKNDATTDNTDAIRYALQTLSNTSFTRTYRSSWKHTNRLYFPKGVYVVNDPIIRQGDSFAHLLMFSMEGEGINSSIIEFHNDGIFMNNYELFGSATFKNLYFRGREETSTFLHNYSYIEGNASNIRFDACRIQGWNIVYHAEGSIMGSEMSFNDCKINYIGTTEHIGKVFYMNNPQAVNIRVVNTDIELFTGSLVYGLRGTHIVFYQGSIIPNNAGESAANTECCIIKIPSDAVFESTNIIFNQSRFELKGYVYLLKEEKNIYGRYEFFSCDMGGYNLTDDTTFYPIKTTGYGMLKMMSCSNTSKLRISHKGTALMPLLVSTDNLYFDFIENSRVEENDSQKYFVIQSADCGIMRAITYDGIKDVDFKNITPQCELVRHQGLDRRRYMAISTSINSVTIRGAEDGQERKYKILNGGDVVEKIRVISTSSSRAYAVKIYTKDKNGNETLQHTFNVPTTSYDTEQAFSLSDVREINIGFDIGESLASWTYLYPTVIIEGS